MSQIKWEFESELALKAASTAGEILSSIGDIQNIQTKDGHKDVVTEYDLQCEKIISEIIAKSKHSIVGEEIGNKNADSFSAQADATWFVDPIDGTTNFVSGMPFYCSSVGLVERGEFVVGAVSVPKLKELYFTFGDQGSYLNGKRLSCKNTSLSQATLAVSFSNAKKFADRRAKEYSLYGRVNEVCRTALRLGSAAVNICYVADGRLHGAYGFNASLWDIAGALAVAKGAGCTVAVQFKPGTYFADYVVGSSQVVQELRQILKEEGHQI
jgi:myo-inositol-1(or 4)-monophosphatase